MEEKIYFRGSLVGGYKKDDVHKCIQEIKQASEQEMNEKEGKLEEYKQKYTDLLVKYEELEIEKDALKKEVDDYKARKEIIYNYELEARTRADKLVERARIESEIRIKKAKREAKRRFDYAMEKYKEESDNYRIQVHESSEQAFELQKQLDDIVKALYQANEDLRLKVGKLYSSTDKKHDIFEEVQVEEIQLDEIQVQEIQVQLEDVVIDKLQLEQTKVEETKVEKLQEEVKVDAQEEISEVKNDNEEYKDEESVNNPEKFEVKFIDLDIEM